MQKWRAKSNKGGVGVRCSREQAMASSEVKLLPCARALFLALKLKGIEYEVTEEDLHNKSAMLLQYNPVYKRVPVLVHNGKPIAEFLHILDYVDDTWKDPPLLPADPHERAKPRLWAKTIDEELFGTGGKAMFGVGNRRTQGVREFQEYAKLLEKELRLKGKDFFGGDAIGYVDIAAILVPFVFGKSQELVGVELLSENRLPSIFKWAEKIYSMDLFNKCYPPKEKRLAYMRAQIVASKGK